jgi:aminoglycoside 2''-phosphotransferase
MTSEIPWATEAEISVEQVLDLLAADQPQLHVQQMTYLGEGWSSFVFLADGRWVLRFPKRRDVERRLEKEIRILPLLERHLTIAVPHIAISGKSTAHFPFRYVGYEKLDGVFAWDLDDHFDREGVACSLGSFLSELHAFPPAEALAAGCEEHYEPFTSEALESVRREFARTPDWPGRAALAELMERYLGALTGESLGRPEQGVLTHADLLPDHLLLPASRDRVSGVIDWGETGIRDPAADFAGLFYWRGRDLVRDVLAHYSGPADPNIIERARFIALPVGIGDVFYGLAASRPEYFRVGLDCVMHCLEGTPVPPRGQI